MDGTRQYMAPENIVRPEEERLTPDLKWADLSKVDTYALGVILINMLTGNYLFESCLTSEYIEIVTDQDRLARELRQKVRYQMDESEIADLAQLLQGMLSPEADQRLSITELLEANLPQTRWLNTGLYKANTEMEIASELRQRVHQGGSLGQVLTCQRTDSVQISI